MQLDHSEHKFKKQKFPIIILCDRIRTPENIGMIFRVAEAFGVEKIILNSESPSPEDRSVKRISRDANKIVSYNRSENATLELRNLKELGYRIIALEITSNSKPIQELKINNEKIVLVLGAERNGISHELLNECDDMVHITMYGNNSSMNVVNALSIALFELTNKLVKD
jgi:tRNA G18 (ribose-2'-O)-methylase SpoU